VEEEVLNELVRLALSRGCTRLKGVYRRTAKNEMVRDFYGRMGFALVAEDEESREFELALEGESRVATKIQMTRCAYESGGNFA
jgi:predicted enzyme involved in methoxymalonyl-ACP biosynthesis